MARVFEREGYFPTLYSNFRECIDDIHNNLEYDLLMCDRGGVQVGNRFMGSFHGDDIGILSKELHPQTPIITLSGFNDRPSYANALLVKPVNIERLFRTIDMLLH